MFYSSDGKFAALPAQSRVRWSIIIRDLDKQRRVRELDLKGLASGNALHFSWDDRVVVYVENLGRDSALIYQPIDGIAPHIIFKVGHEPVEDFGWSPSGKELAALRSISTSYVALISDKSAKPAD
jgi:hypothetical protein